MWVPIVFRNWKQLDEWDATIFVVGLAVGSAAAVATGLAPAYRAPSLGFAAGLGGIEVRRLLSPALVEKEREEPPPASLIVMILTAFGIFGMLVALVGCLIAYGVLTSESTKLDLGTRAAVVGFPIVCAGVAATMIAVGRWLRRG